MAQQQKRSQLGLSTPKKAQRMTSTDFETLLDEIDFVEKSMTVKIQRAVEKQVQDEFGRCGLSTFGSQMGLLMDRMERLEKRVGLQEKAQEAMKCLSSSVVKKVEELHETTGKNLASIKMLTGTSRKLVVMGWNHDQRLEKLEQGAVGSGNDKTQTGDGGKGGKTRCSFCGRELTVKYLATHQKSHCKKAADLNQTLKL